MCLYGVLGLLGLSCVVRLSTGSTLQTVQVACISDCLHLPTCHETSTCLIRKKPYGCVLASGVVTACTAQASLASCFPTLHTVFTSDQIHEHFQPMALRLLSTTAVAARPAVAEGIACFLRHVALLAIGSRQGGGKASLCVLGFLLGAGGRHGPVRLGLESTC